MNTLEILHDQRKAIEAQIAGLQDELGDIHAAIRAIEGRKGNRNAADANSGPKPVLASALRPRSAAPA